MVILYILTGLLFIYLSGLYSTNILFKDNKSQSINLAIGYIFTQLIFLVGIYISNAYYSFYFLMSLFLILTLANIKSIIKQIKNINFKIMTILLVLIVLLGYNFIYYGLEAYWHTASEDCFDAVNGKDYILGNISTLQEFMLNNSAIENFNELRGKIDSFLYTDIVLQYTSVTLWSLLLNLNLNLDFFLVQSIINLIMMFFGIFLLTKEIFYFSNIKALLISFISIYSNLYLTTYFNTHEGSMMFGAVIPYVLYLFFKYEQTNFKDMRLLFLLIISSIFLLFTYKHPYVFFLVPAIIYIFKNKVSLYLSKLISNKIYLVTFVLILFMALFYMYGVLEHYLNFRDSRFRSWSISLEPEMLLIYWGLVQSEVTNIGSATGIIYHNLVFKYILYVISSIYVLITIYGYFLFSKKYTYFKYFMLFWILFFLVFKYILADSYYFYKFLYTTQFIFVIFFIFGLNSLYHKNKFKVFTIIIFLIFMSSNIYYNIDSNKKIYDGIHNKNSIVLKEILEIPNDIVKESFLEIPKQYLKQIAQINLRTNRIFTKVSIEEAQYIILMKGIDDVYFESYRNNDVAVVFENSSFKVIKKPKYYISLYGPWESEVFQSAIGNFSNIPFRWMSHDTNKGKIIITSKTDKKYLQTCFESGPSIGFGKLDINIDNKQYISQGVACKYFELDNNKIEYQMYSNIKGKKLLPFDARSLEYKIANIRNTNIKYDIDVLQILNPKNDVANQDFNKLNNILLGNGWYPQELENMRWASSNIELLVMNSELENLKVQFELEPGPSLKNLPLKIEVLNDKDEKVGDIEVSDRQKIILDLKVEKDKKYQIIKLKVLNDTKKLKFDPRDLNFRVFSIKAVD